MGFRFRGIDFRLALSHGLFSSADVDAGTRLLLKVVSALWDEDLAAGRPLPASALDAGCGVGVIGIACAAALKAAGVAAPRLRCQDRDELARIFTAVNARAALLGPDVLEAYAEPLLSSPPGSAWDLILSNVPAKAGVPVLRDFVRRSAALLSDGGRCACVVVEPLAEAFATWIGEAGAPILRVEAGSEHRVFVYGRSVGTGVAAEPEGMDASELPPAYLRGEAVHSLAGSSYSIRAYHGVADFDTPGRDAALAAKLTDRIWERMNLGGEGAAVLVHEGAQGHYSAWLACRLNRPRFVLSGRNVLALAASRTNLGPAAADCRTVSAADPLVAREELLSASGSPYALAVLFPELVPRTERLGAHWEALGGLLPPGGTAIVALPSTDAERFDRLKPAAFGRLSELKRDGFRALAYRRLG